MSYYQRAIVTRVTCPSLASESTQGCPQGVGEGSTVVLVPKISKLVFSRILSVVYFDQHLGAGHSKYGKYISRLH